ncbi:Na/Pi cotransporter family protein [bacterium]|nr:Na/Pi cotransporter family protein [bacterium]
MQAGSIVETLFMVLGGLGVFLLGMKNMSEGMQAIAGSKLRRLIGAVTNNRLIACGVGTLVTCLIQSSSVTTVMVVGMVNAGIMTLTQAVGVILGANVGTTITGWILVLKVSKYGLPLLGVAALVYLFSSRERLRYTAMVFLGLGMVFFGLELMKDGFEPIGNLPAFQEWFIRFTPDSYFGVIKCALVGAVLTAIIQSSSATLGITMGLAYVGVIKFEAAAALVLGENIGTTITAYLASLGASTNAKRAAYAHMLVNVLGVLWITAIFGWYILLIREMLGAVGVFPDVASLENGEETFPSAMKAIALTHTGFNVINAMIFLPAMPFLARFLTRIVPEKHLETPHLTFIDVRMLDTPAIGIQQSWDVILRMGEDVRRMMFLLRDSIAEEESNQAREKEIFHLEEVLDLVQKEVVEFLSDLLSGTVTHDVMDNGRWQLRLADEFETIGDYIRNILKLNLKRKENAQELSEDGRRELLDLHDRVAAYMNRIVDAVKGEDREVLKDARREGADVTRLMKHYRSLHLSRVENGQVAPLTSLIYTDILNSYRRIKDHGVNIAEVLGGEK